MLIAALPLYTLLQAELSLNLAEEPNPINRACQDTRVLCGCMASQSSLGVWNVNR